MNIEYNFASYDRLRLVCKLSHKNAEQRITTSTPFSFHPRTSVGSYPPVSAGQQETAKKVRAQAWTATIGYLVASHASRLFARSGGCRRASAQQHAQVPQTMQTSTLPSRSRPHDQPWCSTFSFFLLAMLLWRLKRRQLGPRPGPFCPRWTSHPRRHDHPSKPQAIRFVD